LAYAANIVSKTLFGSSLTVAGAQNGVDAISVPEHTRLVSRRQRNPKFASGVGFPPTMQRLACAFETDLAFAAYWRWLRIVADRD